MAIYIKDKLTSNKIYFNILVSLIPLILYAVYKAYSSNSSYPILLIIVSIFSLVFLEIIYGLISKQKMNITKSLCNALIIAALIPMNVSFYVIPFTLILAVIISKVSRIIFKADIFNSSVLTILFVYIFEIFINHRSLPLSDSLFEVVINFSLSNILDLGLVLTICSLVFLVVTKSIKYRVALSYIITLLFCFSITVFLLGDSSYFNYITSTLLVTSIYIVSDFKTSPSILIGQIFYGIIIGIFVSITAFIEQLSFIYAFLLGGCIKGFIDILAMYAKEKRIIAITCISVLLIITILTGYIGSQLL